MVSGFHKAMFLVVAIVKFMMLCTPRMTEIPVYCSLLVKYNLGSHSCNVSLGYLGEISLKTYPDVNHLWNLCSYHILNLQNKTCRKTC